MPIKHKGNQEALAALDAAIEVAKKDGKPVDVGITLSMTPEQYAGFRDFLATTDLETLGTITVTDISPTLEEGRPGKQWTKGEKDRDSPPRTGSTSLPRP